MRFFTCLGSKFCSFLKFDLNGLLHLRPKGSLTSLTNSLSLLKLVLLKLRTKVSDYLLFTLWFNLCWVNWWWVDGYFIQPAVTNCLHNLANSKLHSLSLIQQMFVENLSDLILKNVWALPLLIAFLWSQSGKLKFSMMTQILVVPVFSFLKIL